MKKVRRYFNSIKDYEMEVFGEKYDLSKCTPEERAGVEKWYDNNKSANVPLAADTPSRRVRTEIDASGSDETKHHPETDRPSDPLDFELAVESLKGGSNFNPTLKGKEKSIQLYKMVHPLGGNMTLDDAAKLLGTNRVTGWRWLKRLQALNPDVYDLDSWPTKAQTDVYRLIHPDLGGLTYREAAKALNSTYQHVVDMMSRMRQTHPQAFAFERLERPKIHRYAEGVQDDQITEKF